MDGRKEGMDGSEGRKEWTEMYGREGRKERTEVKEE